MAVTGGIEMRHSHVGNERLAELKFIEDIFELAFGADAYEKDYSYSDVLEQLIKWSNMALTVEVERGEV